MSFERRRLILVWLITFAVVDFSLIATILADRYGDVLSVQDVIAMVIPTDLSVGTRIESIEAFDPSGIHSINFCPSRTGTTLIFSSCAKCNEDQITLWQREGINRGDRLVTVLTTTPNQIARQRVDWGLAGEIYAPSGVGLFDRLGIKSLPMAVVLSGQGTVLAVRRETRR